jgi:hypothetical protein
MTRTLVFGRSTGFRVEGFSRMMRQLSNQKSAAHGARLFELRKTALDEGLRDSPSLTIASQRTPPSMTCSRKSEKRDGRIAASQTRGTSCPMSETPLTLR